MKFGLARERVSIFVRQPHFVCGRAKRRILLLLTWQLNHPPTKASEYADRVIPSLRRENEGFLTHFTQQGSNEIAMSSLFRRPSRPGVALHAKRKRATDSSRHDLSSSRFPAEITFSCLRRSLVLSINGFNKMGIITGRLPAWLCPVSHFGNCQNY